jgi:hypothetical protein
MANVRQPHTIANANASCLRFGNKGRLICTSRWMRRLAVHIEPEATCTVNPIVATVGSMPSASGVLTYQFFLTAASILFLMSPFAAAFMYFCSLAIGIMPFKDRKLTLRITPSTINLGAKPPGLV